MNKKTESPQALPQELPGVAPGSPTALEGLVQALVDRLAQLPDCRPATPMPQPCNPALEAWLVTQMSDAQFLEFRAAYAKWADEQRQIRNRADFRVTLTPRRSLCEHGPAVTPIPNTEPTPATHASGAATASQEVN